MGKDFFTGAGLRKSGKFICAFSLWLFFLFTLYLIFMGSFFWEGGNSAYANRNVILRGCELAGGVFLLFCAFHFLIKALRSLDDRKTLMVSVVCGAGMLFLQILFVLWAKAGIRYDALKVMDEAIALFSQKGIQAGDLNGYFARYSNNYAITIMTHWFIKIFRAIGIIHQDFSNAVIVMQLVNVLFVDAAFAGAWAFIRKYAGIRQAAVFMIYTAFNPLSYVWLPFYYTNTCAMAFAIWGAYLLLGAFCDGKEEGVSANGGSRWFFRKTKWKKPAGCVASGVLFSIGFEIRATVIISFIAALITLYCIYAAGFKRNGENERRKESVKSIALRFILLFLSMGLVGGLYEKTEDYYLAFDEKDTEFPITHWIAMGLSDTGTFSPADEEYTMSFLTAEEKEEATISLMKKRGSELGTLGVAKLYLKKLALTFGDGAGGYHSELNLSKEYGTLWQIVYGVHRDPLLAVTQIFYLLSLTAGLGTAVMLWKRRLGKELFFLPLFLLGSYLFQMLWEAGTIYSIGTMYVNGCMTAVFMGREGRRVSVEAVNCKGRKREVLFKGTAVLCIVLVGTMIGSFCLTDYVEVSMSVDQFLFQADNYIALSEGMEISQTFTTEKNFSTIALQVHNPEGKYNDSIYGVYLYDKRGNLIKERDLRGNMAVDYAFCSFAFKNCEGISDYEIKIKKKWGTNDLVFLYYDTGHYDVYPEGRLTGLTQGNMADLIFRVYWKENKNGGNEDDRRKGVWNI